MLVLSITHLEGADVQASRGRLAPIATLSRKDGAVREIRRAIARGDLAPGDKLTETSLSEDLAISRPTLREALAQLVNEGFLVQEPYRGIRVAALGARQMVDTARARMALDRLAATYILEDETGERVARVRAAYEEYAAEIDDDDLLVRHEAHVRFHRRMWEASDNETLISYWPITEAQITLQLVEDQRLASDRNRDAAVHRHIVEALEARDPDAVEEALRAHTMDSV